MQAPRHLFNSHAKASQNLRLENDVVKLMAPARAALQGVFLPVDAAITDGTFGIVPDGEFRYYSIVVRSCLQASSPDSEAQAISAYFIIMETLATFREVILENHRIEKFLLCFGCAPLTFTRSFSDEGSHSWWLWRVWRPVGAPSPQDGIGVIVAGRDLERAIAFTRELAASPFLPDITDDLSPIAKAVPDFVADAAGPFQAYGNDPYRVLRFCIQNGINYLDLSDDAEFTAGITSLNQAAAEAECVVLSGVSSVPAISAAAVTALSGAFSELLVIETAIVPGNRVPRGRSVVASMLSQTGEPLNVWRGGKWRMYRGWSGAKALSFGPG